MQRHGLKLNGEFQIVCDMAILPSVYLNPYNKHTGQYFGTEQTFSIHDYAGSWLTDDELAQHDYNTKTATTKFRPLHELQDRPPNLQSPQSAASCPLDSGR